VAGVKRRPKERKADRRRIWLLEVGGDDDIALLSRVLEDARPGIAFKCVVCGYVARSLEEAIQHFRERHGEIPVG